MTTLIGQVGPGLTALLIGWAVLWPMRGGLGAWGYHLSAMPVGLLVYTEATAIGTLLGRPFDWLSIAAAVAATCALTWWLGRPQEGSPGSNVAVSARSFAVAAGVLLLFGAVVSLLRVTVATNDALTQFWPMSIGLVRGDGLSIKLMSARSVMVPSLGAVHILFRANWAYVSYALAGANVLALVGWLLARSCREISSRAMRLAIVGGVTAALAAESSFVFHSVFVHSHMISALYLTLSIAALWFARSEADSRGLNRAWLVVGGLAAAGFALVRPDGLAYVFLPTVAALSVLTGAGSPQRSAPPFFATLVAPVVLTYVAAYSQLGIWEAEKLSGAVTVALVALLAASSSAPWVTVRLRPPLDRWLTGERLMQTVQLIAAVMLIVVALRSPSSALATASNSLVNLFGAEGGYSALWYSLGLLALIAVWTGDAMRPNSLSRFIFATIALFFLIAGVVHVGTHEGRVGDLDSFTRLVFHVVPMSFWFVGLVLARIAKDRQPPLPEAA